MRRVEIVDAVKQISEALTGSKLQEALAHVTDWRMLSFGHDLPDS
jgi:hypothetical protein